MKEKLIKEMVNRINNMKEVINQLEQSMEHISKVIMENNPAYSDRLLETQSRLAFREINPIEHEILYVQSTIINQQFDEFTNGKSMYDNNIEFSAKELRENKFGEKVLYYFAMLYHIDIRLMDLFIKDLVAYIMRTTELSEKHYNMMIRKTELELEFSLFMKSLFTSNDMIEKIREYEGVFTNDEISLYKYYISRNPIFTEKDTKIVLDALNSLDNISNFKKHGF